MGNIFSKVKKMEESQTQKSETLALDDVVAAAQQQVLQQVLLEADQQQAATPATIDTENSPTKKSSKVSKRKQPSKQLFSSSRRYFRGGASCAKRNMHLDMFSRSAVNRIATSLGVHKFQFTKSGFLLFKKYIEMWHDHIIRNIDHTESEKMLTSKIVKHSLPFAFANESVERAKLYMSDL